MHQDSKLSRMGRIASQSTCE
ncbi:hypothetical protein Pint_33946 [Pistacia integerrima]|uniref:Uncharacterized protein n=1 Tax=Pistacia integerrima TaxID=434235 RepID=A0ACC0X2S5_9ROSI|nr:hypothetical protein Pint_33946 [Pistacia integerrima]KAJ0076729.1 hypothetical protein Patl1_35546 [Pistacia atlantica]